MSFCDVLDIVSKLDSANHIYVSGWLREGLMSSPIIATWNVLLQNMNNQQVCLPFDITNDKSLLIVDLDLKILESNNHEHNRHEYFFIPTLGHIKQILSIRLRRKPTTTPSTFVYTIRAKIECILHHS